MTSNWMKKTFRVYWSKREIWVNVSIYFKPDETDWYLELINNIEYVHQLQNLIFALTGNELT